MNDHYQGKFRIPTARLNGWDYGSHALYYITICTKDKIPYFGSIEPNENGAAELSSTIIGKIAHDNWTKIPNYHPYVELGSFVIMPDHMHAIIY